MIHSQELLIKSLVLIQIVLGDKLLLILLIAMLKGLNTDIIAKLTKQKSSPLKLSGTLSTESIQFNQYLHQHHNLL